MCTCLGRRPVSDGVEITKGTYPFGSFEIGPLAVLSDDDGLRLGSYLMADDCSSALHGGPPARPPAFNCTLFHTGIR